MKTLISISLLSLAAVSASAEQFGLFTYRATNVVTITDYPEDATGEVEIPAEIDGMPVTRIGNYAFEDCSSLTKISIPSSVTTIDKGAFSYCSGLTSLSIPDAVTHINDVVFEECSRLNGLAIPDRVSRIGYGAFRGCSALTSLSIPDTVARIEGDAFMHCSGLTSISIPERIEYIENSTFEGCSGLTSITLPKRLLIIGQRAFADCRGLTSISIPEKLMFIGDAAFSGCSSLTSVNIPAGTASIGPRAFLGCSKLTSITVATENPDYRSADGVLFNPEMTELIVCPGGKTGHYAIPPGVTHIEGNAFSGCSQLTNITIPEKVDSIGYAAFRGCNSLTTANFLGDAPELQNPESAFVDAAPTFSVSFLSSSTGFTTPTWHGYPTVMINEGTHPAASWLLRHDLPYDTNIQGAGLLMAYALNADPNDPSPAMPTPAIDPTTGTLAVSFHAGSPGVTYKVEVSSYAIIRKPISRKSYT